MSSLNKDTVTALILFAITCAFFWETFNIPNPGYSSMGSAVWPRVILVPLSVLCVVYFVQSLRRKATVKGRTGGIATLIGEYRNPIMCFSIFFLFLLTINFLGMLIAGILLTFLLLTVVGNRTPKALAMHLVISLVSVGLVWTLFTFILRVYLPEGELLRIY